MATLSVQVRKEVEDKLREAASTSHREPEALVSALIDRIVSNADLWLIVATHLDSDHFSFEALRASLAAQEEELRSSSSAKLSFDQERWNRKICEIDKLGESLSPVAARIFSTVDFYPDKD